MMKSIFLLCLAVICFHSFAAPSVLIRETIEAAAKISGKSLSHSASRAAQISLRKAMAQYGDDAVRQIVKSGGLEALESGTKYGDDFWRLCKGSTPDTIRRFSLHADDWMPHARRIGTDFIKLEEKAPGLGIKAVETFGDDAVKIFQNAPAEDLSRMIGFANRSSTPAAKKYLVETYQKGGSKFLNAIDSKKIIAGGLSIGAITAAYKISDGTAASLLHLAQHHPGKLLTYSSFWLLVFILIIFFPTICSIWRWQKKRFAEKKEEKKSEVKEEPQT